MNTRTGLAPRTLPVHLMCLGQGEGLPKEDIVSVPIGYFQDFRGYSE